MGRNVETRTVIRAPVALARQVLECHVAEVFGGSTEPGGPHRRFTTELTVDLGHGTTVHQAVEVHAGGIDEAGGDAVTMPVHWAAERHHAFPSFDGTLSVRAGNGRRILTLEGIYEVPFGVLGFLGDLAAGHRVAAQSLEALTTAIGCRVDELVDADRPPGGLRPRPPGAAHLRDRPRPRRGIEPTADLYLG